MALEAAWPTLRCTRTKVILSLRSSPQVSACLITSFVHVSVAFFLSRWTLSGLHCLVTACSTGGILYTYDSFLQHKEKAPPPPPM